MRLALTTVLVLASTHAFASSIISIASKPSLAGSIVMQSCKDCPPVHAPKTRQSAYKVPVLTPGTQKTEIVDIDGAKALVRTEAWSGGSPVVFISKAPAWLGNTPSIADVHPSAAGSTEADIEAIAKKQPNIDINATTGAVSEERPRPNPPTATPAGTANDFSRLTLRDSR